MQLEDYCQQLLQLNDSRLTSHNNARYFSSVSFGLIEEFAEWAEAKEDINEVGDILAYVTLCLASIEYSNSLYYPSHRPTLLLKIGTNVSQIIINTLAYNYEGDEGQVITKVAGHLKRHYRENQKLEYVTLVYPLAIALRRSGHFIGDVTQANIDKLTDRANRSVLFQGEGGNR